MILIQAIEIIVVIAAILIVGGVIGSYVYKRIKGLPTGECACCQKKMKKAIKRMKKELNH